MPNDPVIDYAVRPETPPVRWIVYAVRASGLDPLFVCSTEREARDLARDLKSWIPNVRT